MSLDIIIPAKSGKTVLIDGDILVYRTGFACETKDDEGNIVPEPKANAFHSINITIDSIMEATDASHYKVYLTGKNNFRFDIATIKPYKGNRPSRKPVLYQDIRDFLIGRHKAIVVDDIEADDALSIEMYKMGDKAILASLDKDLDMVEGTHYNWVKDHMYDIDRFNAYYNFYHQLMTGDSTDNIQGIPRIGPKKADAALDDCSTPKEMYDSARELYHNYYVKQDLTEKEIDDIMVENARLLWMLRKESKEFEWPV